MAALFSKLQSEAAWAHCTREGTKDVSTGTFGVHKSEKASAEHDQVPLNCFFSAMQVLPSFKTAGLNHSVPEQPRQSSFGNSKSLQSETSRRCFSSAGRDIF